MSGFGSTLEVAPNNQTALACRTGATVWTTPSSLSMFIFRQMGLGLIYKRQTLHFDDSLEQIDQTGWPCMKRM